MTIATISSGRQETNRAFIGHGGEIYPQKDYAALNLIY